MGTTTKLSIAIITCSVRPKRINPLVSEYIMQLLRSYLSNNSLQESVVVTLKSIDLAVAPHSSIFTPFTAAEPDIPAALPIDDPTSHYELESTRAWSSEITKHDAFIFVMPQYNLGYPASVKHALDLLYHEWVGKGAWVISYANRGGGKGRVQLEQVLQGLKLQVLGRPSGGEGVAEGAVPVSGVELSIDIREDLKSIAQGKLTEAILESFKEAGVDGALTRAFQKFVEILLANKRR
ncbi:flavoprotein [Auriscalpium vulgare]|uniref:Flavoprotein n=1 Tax=Auriscalpium vulgare TaxID=40419 RepID=A0ACB8SC18_9AGAM|nr:flavoprotein [Auriscalpium vulgare]